MSESKIAKLLDSFHDWLKQLPPSRIPVGRVELGDLGRTRPLSSDFGFDRGLPVDRYYIESFLKKHAQDIKGHVLEIKEPLYTYKFGGERVTLSDVLHPVEGNPKATITADLTSAETIESLTFDCIILTQTLPFIYDTKSAIKTLHRILKPNGVLLITVPGITQISRGDMDAWGHYWSFTTRSIQYLLEEFFLPSKIEIKAYGNVLTAIAFLHGIVTEELSLSQLKYHDPDYEVIITARVLKTAQQP